MKTCYRKFFSGLYQDILPAGKLPERLDKDYMTTGIELPQPEQVPSDVNPVNSTS